MLDTVPLLAVRWCWLLRAHSIEERFPWLTRANLGVYTAGFLYFLVRPLRALPGGAIKLRGGQRGDAQPRVEHG